MTVFFFVPFYVNGWSTDVWMRFARIEEWAMAGFPWHEQLMHGQNYPFGHEMHWTRPLDIIGYALAWPFIPNWGLSKSLEIMSYFTPLIILIIGVRGYFFALRGYLTPKMAFISFWLFFWGIGYAWEQSSVGYYDHHVFHFTILMWTVALIARSFVRTHQRDLLITAGALTALGTWITAEFFINSYIVLIPFVYLWLRENKSLKPAVIYSASYTIFLLAAMSFDHPMSGFLTLDFYRVSLFHVILGAMNCVALAALMIFFKKVRPTFLRRLIYMVLAGCVYLSVLLVYFTDILLVPMADPRVYYIWVSKVTEMAPSYNSAWVVHFGIIPIILAVFALGIALIKKVTLITPMMLLCGTGLLFYTVIFLFHVRVGISTNVFFVLLMSLYFNAVFFPREKRGIYTLCFIILYGLFIGCALKANAVVYRLSALYVETKRDAMKNNAEVEMPKWLKISLQEEAAQNNNTKEAFSCNISDEAIETIKNEPGNDGIFTDIFDAPKILWETKKPIVSGPYHTNVKGSMDVFYISTDRPPYNIAKQIITERGLTQLYIKSPHCLNYLFYDKETKKFNKDMENTFYNRLYEAKEIPDWLELTYHNKDTGEKIYRVKSK